MNYLKLKRMYLVLALVLVIGVTATGCMNQGGNGMLLDSTGDNTDGTAPQRPMTRCETVAVLGRLGLLDR